MFFQVLVSSVSLYATSQIAYLNLFHAKQGAHSEETRQLLQWYKFLFQFSYLNFSVFRAVHQNNN